MGGGRAPKDPPDKEDQARPSPSSPPLLLPAVAATRLADAPILLLVYFHNAIRAELSELRRVALAAAAEAKSVSEAREFVVELSRRFEFLNLVYKYHCAAEDEVVFLALDEHVNNVACTYSLEHEGIDALFDSVSCCLNGLEETENTSKALQELVFCIGTIQSSICKHMLKEEKQVLPLLVKQFNSEEQASLLWQFIGSIPLVVSWLAKEHQTTFGFQKELAKGVRPLSGFTAIKGKFKFQLTKRPLGWKKVSYFPTNIGNNPVDEFRERFHLIQLLYQIHSDAEDEIAFPALEAKGKLQNISHSYAIDHKLEGENFSEISLILEEMYELHNNTTSNANTLDSVVKHQQLCLNLQDKCKAMHKLLSDHVLHEEVELWPLFRECFSLEEQEKIIGNMLGRTGAEILQDMIPWLLESLTLKEQQSIMSLWHKAARNTMFDEWLGEWWEGHKIAKAEEESTTPSRTADPLEIISTYLPRVLDEQQAIYGNLLRANSSGADIGQQELSNSDDKEKAIKGDQKCSECSALFSRSTDKRCNKANDLKDSTNKPGQNFQVTQNFGECEHLMTMSQEDLEAAIRRVSSDTSLDPGRKSHVMQNLLMSRWILKQQISNLEVNNIHNGEGIPGQHPSYRDPLQLVLGCKHYKRNCKLLAECCNQLYTCIRCHDEVADHSLDRICKIFDDEREIYHCPYCNLCRVGKGLGIDYFHCMKCNACMSRALSNHICREKCFEDNCPICHEDLFTSSAPVKALPCGHLMHSICFQDYTCTHYTCPICSKSLGDMQVYFRMLDALLLEEKIPDEYHGRTQVRRAFVPIYRTHLCSSVIGNCALTK
ncbi:Zinc finger, RING-type [Corchorus olitorius]|uniref:Zinc finger, RING-type n=1 Tax=Corchorus olitorius TaxID=93759 RepID=A0A1R3GGL6_9ROSI|nr:Zinc finger, RING-type [Corchorus olitorius]